jgi:hypothetical protein
MSARTVFLGKLLGLYCLLIGLAMMLHGRTTAATVTALMQDAPAMFVVGIIALIAGLAMVLGHNIWSGGALPVLVTLIGWGTLIKGLLFVFLTPDAEAAFFLTGLRYQQLSFVYAAFSVVLGIYLAYAGFTSRAEP